MSVAQAKAAELTRPPPANTPYSVALEDSEQPGRSKIYRNWKYTKSLLTSLDPAVSTAHELFEQRGKC